MMDDMEDFTGFDISSAWVIVQGLYVVLMHSVCVYRSTFKDNINKSATERLVKKVKGNNKFFLERDIHGKDEF